MNQQPIQPDVRHERLMTHPHEPTFGLIQTMYLPTGEPRNVEATRVELIYRVNHWKKLGFGTWVVTLKEENNFIGYGGIRYLHEEPDRDSKETLPDGTNVEVIVGVFPHG